MNPILQICPECNKHTKVELDKDNIHINCECGYNYTMNVKQIINQFNHTKSNTGNNDKTFSDHH